jgi:hypothetical protein
MSISPAQMMLQVASTESAAPPRNSTPAAVPTAATGAASPAESASSAPAVSPPTPLSTDIEIDSKHQVYYEYVDDRTGDVVFEIPPEALRKIGESLNVALVGGAGVPSIDIES